MADNGGLLRDVLHDAARLLSASPALAGEARAEGAEFSSVEAEREARWLVAAVLNLSPGDLGWMLSAGGFLSSHDIDRVERATRRRATGEPTAYCAGSAPFRHLVLAVDRRVLIPRPETEIVVGEVLRVTSNIPGGIAVDVGTGSGAIALSLATEGRFDRVIATDLSDDALVVAAANAETVAAAHPQASPVEFRQGADLSPLGGLRARVIVSNPPYIAYSEAAALPRSVRDWEPTVALVTGDDGMARYSAILAGAHELLEPFGWVVFEVDARRAQRTAALATTQGYQQVQVVHDLTGRERVVLAQYVPA